MDPAVVLRGNSNRYARRSHVVRSICRPLLSVSQLTKLEQLREYLNDNLRGADAKWMTFVTAVLSYRYSTMVLPYPPSYMGALEDNGINALSIIAAGMPNMKTVHYELQHNEIRFHQHTWQHIALLHWLLIESGVPHLRQLQLENDRELLWEQIGQSPSDRPLFVFCVEPANPQLNGNSCCFYNGHIDQLYSLISGQARVERYELLSDLELACKTAELCPGWGQSLCGSMLRCVAICEWQEGVLKTRYLLIYGKRLQANDMWQKEEKELQQAQEQQHQQQQEEQQQATESDVSEGSTMGQMLKSLAFLLFNNSYALWLRRIGGQLKEKIMAPISLLLFLW
ncbi:protein mono-ADP-ribosyltransferase Parp16-like [Drosophila tropicalis]|uniref:protein mono-ADP-ribosyltransferase Parp16-like n=1 Tax=Drosophila tropicalis TaxID=46794 RepID=UPI0035AB9376